MNAPAKAAAKKRRTCKKGQHMMAADGRNWSIATSTEGSKRKGYWITPKSKHLLDNIQNITGYGSSDIINDAIALLNYQLVNQDREGLDSLAMKIGLETIPKDRRA